MNFGPDVQKDHIGSESLTLFNCAAAVRGKANYLISGITFEGCSNELCQGL